MAAILGATWSSRVCPVRSRRGAAQMRACTMPLRAAVRALDVIGPACAAALLACRRAPALAAPARALALPLELLACDFVRSDTRDLPEMCFPA